MSLSALRGFSFLFSFGGRCHIIPWVVVVKACAAFTLRRKGARIFYTGGRVDRGPWAVVVVVDDDVDRLRAGVVVWEGWGVSALCPRRACCSLGLGTLADAGGRDILTPRLPIQLREGWYVGKGRVRTVVVDVHPSTHLAFCAFLSCPLLSPFLFLLPRPVLVLVFSSFLSG